MNYREKEVLVTGSEGFIGSALTEKLLEMGAHVKGFVLYNFKGDLGWVAHLSRKIELYFGDVRDYNAVEDSMQGVDTVFHLAASVSVPYSILHPRETVDTNIFGTLNVLKAAQVKKTRRVVHISSSETFGTPKYVPIDEKHPPNPQSPYAASKVAADSLCKSFYYSYGLPVVIIRPFNTFGPRQSPRAVIPTIILQLLNGDVLKLGNIGTSRDFTYVEDTVKGILLGGLLEANGEEINLGTGTEISIDNLAKLIARLIGRDKYTIREDRSRVRRQEAEVMRLISDNAKAKNLLHWKPAYTLEEGLAKTIRWFKKYRGLYKNLDYP
jgi:NAD dependent epimerase/dehydratase